MEEIIKKLDEADALIRKELSSETCKSLPNTARMSSLRQSRDKIQDAITALLLVK
ncbi:MAG: hypothetical protein ABSF21_00115 [Dehalococcoidia bacterium]|jgi:hypothetical protein